MPVWYSQTNILGAQQWQDQIGAALRRCDWFVVVLSPQSVNSMWVKREVSFGLAENRLDNRITPVQYQLADIRDLHWTLTLFQTIDFTGTFDAGSTALLQQWGLGYRQQS